MDLAGTEASGRSTLALVELAVLGVLDTCPRDSEIRWKIWLLTWLLGDHKVGKGPDISQ